MYSIQDLVTPVTYEEAKESFYEALAIVGVDTTMWKPLGVYRTIIAAAAIMFSVASVLVSKIAGAGWYELATGAWLTLVARYQYGVIRVEPSFAQGPIIFTNTGGGNYNIVPGEVVLQNALTLVEYTNLTAFTVPPGSVGTPTVVTLDDLGNPILFRAVVAGSASTSGRGQITKFSAPLNLVTCTNDLALVGLDEEGDPSVRTRCAEKLGARTANGPEDTYASVARAVKRADGTPIGLNRIAVTKDGKGGVFIATASATGQIAGTANDNATDLGRINDAIQKTCAPLSVTAVTSSKAGYAINYTYELWMLDNSGLTPAQVQALVETTVPQKLAEVPIGGHVIDGEPGTVYQDYLRSMIENVRPEIFRVVLTVPAADVLIPVERPPIAGAATCVGIHQVSQRAL